jgi:hypothetical protein
MLTERKRRRIQRALILTGLGLVLYYFGIYQPLSRRAAALDAPLLRYWGDLAALTYRTNGFQGEELPRIEEALRQVQASLAALTRSEKLSRASIELDAGVRDRLKEPFQNSDFQNERQLGLEELARLAGQRQVVLAPAVAAGFPEYTADRQQPALLWVQLSLLRHLLTTALNCQVGTVLGVRLPPVQFHGAATTNGLRDFLAEVPLQVQMAGSAGAVTKFLQCLPLRAEEIKNRGLPEASTNKPVLFIDQLFLRKEGRDKPDAVKLDLTVCGFVYRDPAMTNW